MLPWKPMSYRLQLWIEDWKVRHLDKDGDLPPSFSEVILVSVRMTRSGLCLTILSWKWSRKSLLPAHLQFQRNTIMDGRGVSSSGRRDYGRNDVICWNIVGIKSIIYFIWLVSWIRSVLMTMETLHTSGWQLKRICFLMLAR